MSWLAVTDTRPERYRREAEDCLRHAEAATSPLDKQSWLWLAEDWTRLATDAEQRRERERRGQF
jgi:hypothetical protein